MKASFKIARWGLPIAGAAAILTLVAWDNQNPRSPQPSPKNIIADTIPEKYKREKRLAGDRDLDRELRELDRAARELEKVRDIDFDHIKKELERSLEKLDLDKAKLETEKALREVDMEKIKSEIEQSLRKVDFDKMQQELENSLKSADWDNANADLKKGLEQAKKEMQKARIEMERSGLEMKKELQKELGKINFDDISKEMEKAKEEIKRSKADLDLEKINLKDEMSKARQEIEKAKEEFKGYQQMIYSMESDGLLKTSEDYIIEYENGQISVNGKKIPDEMNRKYEKYFKKKTTIKKEDGQFNIDLD